MEFQILNATNPATSMYNSYTYGSITVLSKGLRFLLELG